MTYSLGEMFDYEKDAWLVPIKPPSLSPSFLVESESGGLTSKVLLIEWECEFPHTGERQTVQIMVGEENVNELVRLFILAGAFMFNGFSNEKGGDG